MRVLVAASSPMARTGLEALLASDATAAVASSSLAMLAHGLETSEPDVVVLHLTSTEADFVSALTAGPEARMPAVVVLADDPSVNWTRELLRAGVRAVLPSDAHPNQLVAAVQAAAEGLVVLSPQLTAALVAGTPAAQPRPISATPFQALTRREAEVLQMLAEGLGNKIIAARLHISEHTVKFHLSSIFGKLHAGSRTEAVTLGARLGYIII